MGDAMNEAVLLKSRKRLETSHGRILKARDIAVTSSVAGASTQIQGPTFAGP